MPNIIFVTGNARKLGEARQACDQFGITVEQVKLDIDEIQSHDPLVIANHKANEAFRRLRKPLVVTDSSWKIPALNGFPGGYMKDIAQWFEPEDFIALLVSKQDKRINFTETVVYRDITTTKVFSKSFWGKIVDKPRGIGGNSLEQVAEFDGYTLSERHNQGRYSHDPKEYVWYGFAEWFKG